MVPFLKLAPFALVITSACAGTPAPMSATAPPDRPPPAAPAPPPVAGVEPAGPADAQQIWTEAVAGDLDRARRSLAWFRANPPEQTYAGPDYRPEVACSADGQRCAYQLTFPAGAGIVDATGRPLRVLDPSANRVFAFVPGTRVLYMSGTPGQLVDVDTGDVVLDLPEAGWSSMTARADFVVYALQFIEGEPFPEFQDAEEEPDEDDLPQTIGVWEVASRKHVFKKRAAFGLNPMPSLSDDGRHLLVRSDTAGWIWRVSDGQLVAVAKHPGVAVPIAAHGEQFALASYAGTGAEVRLLDARGKVVGRSRACDKPRVLAFSASGKLLAVGGDRQACVLSVPSLAVRFKSPALPKPQKSWSEPSDVTFSRDESAVTFHASGGEEHAFALGGPGAPAPEPAEPVRPDAESPADALAKRLRASLCMVHGHAFPALLCQ